MPSRPEFGGISDEDLSAFMATHPAFADADTSLQAKFSQEAAKLILKRRTAGEALQRSVFLLSESLAGDIDGRSVTHAPLLSNGAQPIGGRIWLVQAQIKNAYALGYIMAGDAEMFAHLIEQGLSSKPTIIIDGDGVEWVVRLYPFGVGEPEFWTEMDLGHGPVPADRLREAIDRFWYQVLRTPEAIRLGGGQAIWSDPARGVPLNRPEQLIQGRLRDALIGAFPQRLIRAELRTEEGRGDIFIVSSTTALSGASAQTTDWALELKALCDMTSTGRPLRNAPTVAREALEKGVVQAAAYRATQNGVQAALCCFEMRNTNESDVECFACIKEFANTFNVKLWRWPLFRSSNDGRMARFGSSRS